MPRVHLPDGRIINFPTTMTITEINTAVETLLAEQGGTPVERFAAGATRVLNPIAASAGLKQAFTDPKGTIETILADMRAERQKAAVAPTLRERVGREVAAVVPVLGPMAARAGERAAGGDIAGAAGEAAGMILPSVLGPAARLGARAVPNRVAAAAERGATRRVTREISPTVGPNKQRFGAMAREVAPTVTETVAREGAPWSRAGLQRQFQSHLEAAEMALDEVADQRLEARTFATQPLIAALQAEKQKLTTPAVKASKWPPTTKPIRDREGNITFERQVEPIGEDVVSGPASARAAVIDRAIQELKQLGPVTRYESIRTMRQQYDGVAKKVYAPSITEDIFRTPDGREGAADVAGALRAHLGQWDPATKEANATYHLQRSISDVLKAVEAVEQVRPHIGRQVMMRLITTTSGAHVAGLPGAAAGFVLAPVLESALSAGFTTKLKMAAQLKRLSTTIRGGDLGRTTSLLHQLTRPAKVYSLPVLADVGQQDQR